MGMNIYAKTGDLVVVTEATKNNGYSHDKEKVATLLEIGKPYIVEKTDVNDFSTTVYLKEFPTRTFNSVNFEDYPPLPTPAVDELNLDERFYSEQEVKLIATRFARQSRNMNDVTSNDTITSYENWFKPENFKSVSSTHHNHASFVALVEYTDKLEGLLLNLRHHAGLSDSNIEWIDRVFNENPTN